MVRDVPAIGPKKRIQSMSLPGCPSGKPSGELPAAFRIALKKLTTLKTACLPGGPSGRPSVLWRNFQHAFRRASRVFRRIPFWIFCVWLASVSMHVAHSNSNGGNRWRPCRAKRRAHWKASGSCSIGRLTGRHSGRLPFSGILAFSLYRLPEGSYHEL